MLNAFITKIRQRDAKQKLQPKPKAEDKTSKEEDNDGNYKFKN